jgi:hypothetical protein
VVNRKRATLKRNGQGMPVPDRCLEGLGSARSAVPQFADPRQFADYVRLNRMWQSAIVSARQGERSGPAHMCSVLSAAAR